MAEGPASAEMHVGPGFRIRSDVARPDPATIEAFAAFETPDISDLMNRMYTMRGGIRPMTDANPRILGPARAVKTFPGDNLTAHKSLHVAKIGASVADLGDAVLEVRLNGRTVRAWHQNVPLDDPSALHTALDKPLVHHLLKAADVPVPVIGSSRCIT